MREGVRRWLIRGAWAGLLVTGALLIGLRVGRPGTYTDGDREIAASELRGAGMVVWQSPEVQVELPGPVQGRVARLPDGRLFYGLGGSDGTTDLVLFDPARPAISPEPAYGLNSEHNELAPAVCADGTVFFTSDRPDGSGGYDLYRSRWSGRGFSRPEPLVLCNTAADETDPAAAPDGDELVFARIDPERRHEDGTLFCCRLSSGLEPVALFDPGPAHDRPVDRDPAFTRDGGGLWFVRKRFGVPWQVYRVSLMHGRADEPVRVGGGWGTTWLRGPSPLPSGLGLLQPRRGDGDADLWYVSVPREVYPWWIGQRWLELLLMSLGGSFALLLLLLLLGRRWATLDLLAQCLLLSLLAHVLLFLWLMGVEIRGALFEGREEGGSLEVTVVAAARATSETTGDGQRLANVAAAVRFTPTERTLDVSAPSSDTSRGERRLLESEVGTYEAPAVEDGRVWHTEAMLSDAAEAGERRDGSDAALTTEQIALDRVAVAERAIEDSPREPADLAADRTVVVQAPEAVVARPSGRARELAKPAEYEAPSPTPWTRDAARPAAVALADEAQDAGGGAMAMAVDAPEAELTLAEEVSLRGPLVEEDAATTRAERAEVPEGPVQSTSSEPVAPQALLARSGGETSIAPAAAMRAEPRPVGRRVARPRAAVVMRDPSQVLAAGPAGAEVVSAATDDRPSARVEPVAADSAQPRRAVMHVGLVRPEAGIVPPQDRVKLELPSAAIHRGKPVVVAPRQAGAIPEPVRNGATSRPDVRRLVALQDDVSDSSQPRAAQTSESPSPVIHGELETVVAPNQLRIVARPERADTFGMFGEFTVAVAPPGSLLERAQEVPIHSAPEAAIAGAPTAYSNRFGPRKAEALERFGGSEVTERAVSDGLRYLAGVQNRDGSWGDRSDYDSKYGLVYVGKTALCVLAFLGAGHTPSSDTEYSEVVRRAIRHLIALQDEDTGAFGPSSCYGHGISTYAIAECYGMTRDQELLPPLEDALVWILRNQGPRSDRRNRGGWGYFSPGLRPDDSFARVSVTSWMVMALESARLSGIELPEEALPRAREYLVNSFDAANGWFRYNHDPSRLRSGWPTLPASTPAGAFCLMLLDTPAENAMVQRATEYTVVRRPRAYRHYRNDDFVLRGQGNVYFWYYGSLCCFLAGGEHWKAWNERLSTLLPAAQSEDGSFRPIDVYAEEAGDTDDERSYTTAMCVLSLEVYYRYFTPLLVGR